MIPCKRPKVTIDRHPSGVAGADQATCHVPGCDWTYTSVKTACEQAAVRHRAEHRAAVPKTHVGGSPTHGFHGSCFDADGWAHWSTSSGCTTRTDVDQAVAHHLSTVHGLVTCP